MAISESRSTTHVMLLSYHQNTSHNSLVMYADTLGTAAIDTALAETPELSVAEYQYRLSFAFPGSITMAVNPVGVAHDTIYLAEHHIYGSSRLGVQRYDSTLRNTASGVGDVPVLKLSLRKEWNSYPYGDLIKQDSTHIYGNVITGAVPTLYINTNFGLLTTSYYENF